MVLCCTNKLACLAQYQSEEKILSTDFYKKWQLKTVMYLQNLGVFYLLTYKEPELGLL